MNKKTFIMYQSWYAAFRTMSNEQAGSLIKAIYDYQTDKTAEPDDESVKFVFEIIKEKLDEDSEQYKNIVSARSKAGRSGGRPKSSDSEKANAFSEKQIKAKKANAFSEKQNNPDTDTDTVSDTVSDSDSDTVSEDECSSSTYINYQKVVDDYNATCVSLPSVKSLSNDRRKAIRARLRDHSEADLHEAFEKAEASPFLRGQNDRNWNATFDWILKDRNLAKILDGNYDERSENARSGTTSKTQSLREKWGITDDDIF
ncbi:MAG: DUF6291 domain-containing protein [Lachnospiraceae bacterium]|nr:DUF6291 domain-containing protein [Lachnospiraceae bacterium]